MVVYKLNSINKSYWRFYFLDYMILLETYTMLKSADTLDKYFDFITWFQELGFFHCVSDPCSKSDNSEWSETFRSTGHYDTSCFQSGSL